MSVPVTIRDEAAGGLPISWTLELPAERLTARELIRSRVYQEVQDFNLAPKFRFQGLVQPAEAERMLNGDHLPAKPQVDWRKQFDRAIDAFEAGGFVLLVDDCQVESLDVDVCLTSASTVTFLKLVPLIGG